MDFIEAFTNTIRGIQKIQPKMRAGVSREALLEAEEVLQLSLPLDFKEFYRVYDGQDEFADNLFDSYSLLSLSSIIQWNKVMQFLEKEFPEINNAVDLEVRRIWGCSAWVPFAATAGGDLLCVDCLPSPRGTVGQVITFYNNSPERELIALSFAVFIEEYIQNIRNGTYIYNKKHANVIRSDGGYMF